MAIYTFGTNVNPAHYVEIPSGSTNPPPRPGATLTLKCRDSTDLGALPDQSVSAITGYFGFTTTDRPFVDVSADGGTTWVPLVAIEAEKAGASAGTVAAQALSTATQASTLAQQALTASQGGGVTIAGVGPQKVFTLAQIGAQSVTADIDPNRITGLQPVATSGLGADLNDVGQVGGYAPLDDSAHIPAQYLAGGGGGNGGLIILQQNANGTWPARSTVSTDPTEFVVGNPAYDVTKLPTIAADGVGLYAPNPGAGIPGDAIFNKGVTT